MKPHLRQCWCIPPQQNADFVACMEDVLDLYCLAYDPRVPLVCMDEQPRQLVKETRRPRSVAPGKPLQYDYEYERNGTANVFLFTEPLAGWRKANIRERKTAVDWAEEIRELLETDYPQAQKVILVCDNLNTHKIASLYKMFPPQEARRLARRLEIHHTPKHGSWLNIAEIELSVLSRQCLDRRIGDIACLRRACSAWNTQRNERQKGVDWRFTTGNARIRLKRLYPQLKV